VARAELGISQEQLAEMAGVTRQTISSIETGQYVPSALLAFVIAKRLGKQVGEVFTLNGDG
jgi:putative transcriptional regulator